MIKSMTGFGRGEYSDGKRNVTAEIKTVNHRYADITVKMPKRYSFAEDRIKSIIKSNVKRGKADVSILVENITEGDITVKLNVLVANQYIDTLKALKEEYGLGGEVDIALVSSMPDVLKAIPDVEDKGQTVSAQCFNIHLKLIIQQL